jgi:hypothetical protein
MFLLRLRSRPRVSLSFRFSSAAAIARRSRRSAYGFPSSSTFPFRGRHQLKRPIRVRPAARRAVMPDHEVDGRGFDSTAPFTAQAAEKIFKGHIALAFHQQPHGTADRTASAMQTMQLNHTVRPVR